MPSTWWVDEDDLLDEQVKVLETDFDKNLLLLGPPGSGKTNLMLLRANHIHIADQPEFYIVAYTSLLATFIRTGAHQYSFPANKIVTQTKLYETVLGDHGLLPKRKPGETFDERQASLREKIGILMHQGKGKGSYPALFIDEAQDYDQADLATFFYLAKTVCFSADERQGIYDADGNDLQWLQTMCSPVVHLTYHYRVGKKILAVADKIMEGKFGHEPMLPTSQYKEDEMPSTVEVVGGIPLQKQVEQAAERLTLQLKAYPGEQLGVLVPRRKEDLPKVWDLLSSHPGVKDKITNAHGDEFDPAKPIWVTSVHSSKGLEFRSVHLLCADTVSKFYDHARRVAFTAVTRAKTALIIYHNEELLPFFASALAQKTTGKIPLKQLFGKK